MAQNWFKMDIFVNELIFWVTKTISWLRFWQTTQISKNIARATRSLQDTNLMVFISFQIAPPFKPQVLSDTDTRNFDIEFTGESVELTPPDQDDPNEIDTIAEVAESFSQFSYNDGTLSTASLHSRNSIPLQTE